MFVGKVILIWMLLLVMLGNYFLFKSQAKELSYQNTSFSMFCVELILCALLREKKKHYFEMFWIDTKLKIHWEEV
jgi:hypothetical protein